MAQGIPCYKVILCGEYGVGKTSLFRRFLDNSFTTDTGPRSTVGLDHFAKSYTFGDHQLKLQLWDTAGIERFATLSASYFQSATAAILCYSVVDRESFSCLSQHILDIIMHSETARIFLCGNKADLNSIEEITTADIEEFQIQCDTVLSGTYRVSCKDGTNVRAMFQDIANVLHSDARQRYEDTSLIRPRESSPPPVEKSSCCSASNTESIT